MVSGQTSRWGHQCPVTHSCSGQEASNQEHTQVYGSVCPGRPPSFSLELSQPRQRHRPTGLSTSFKGSVPPDHCPRSPPRCTLGLAACRPTTLAATRPPACPSYTQTRQSHWATNQGLAAEPQVPVASEAALNSENFPQSARSPPTFSTAVLHREHTALE